MPLPNIRERLVYAGATRPLPPPLPGRVVLGYLYRENVDFPGIDSKLDELTGAFAVHVFHPMLDRNLDYWIPEADVRGLFIPANHLRPELEDGDWYYGTQSVNKYLQDNATKETPAKGVVYVSNTARVRWSIEGVSTAPDVKQLIRPLLSPRDLAPVDFEGILDNGPPWECDSE